MCVCVWNIWIDVKLLHVDVFGFLDFSQLQEFHYADDHVYTTVPSFIFTAGGSARLTDTAQRRHSSSWWYRAWSAYCVPAAFFSISLNSTWLSLEPAWRQFEFPMSTSISVWFSQSVKVERIWLCWKGRVSFILLSSSIGFGDGDFLNFSRVLFHRPIPGRYNWSVLARKMHSTTKFATIVLSKCVVSNEN